MKENDSIEVLKELIHGAKVIDLSRTLEPSMPAWPTQARFGSEIYDSYDFGGAALHSRITMSEHTGTHIDAPKHYIKGGRPVDKLSLKALMSRGVRIDATELPPNGLFTPEKIRAFEKQNGEIKKGDIVMFRFGWDSRYRLQPHAAEYLRDWPGLSKEAASYLAGKEVGAVGCDTLAIDTLENETNPAHHTLLGKNIPIIENIVNLDKLPAFSFVIGLPNKFKGGSGSPIRLVALVMRNGAAG